MVFFFGDYMVGFLEILLIDPRKFAAKDFPQLSFASKNIHSSLIKVIKKSVLESCA